MKRETIERVMRIPKDMGRHHVGAYAAQAAYFLYVIADSDYIAFAYYGKIYAGYESRCDDSSSAGISYQCRFPDHVNCESGI